MTTTEPTLTVVQLDPRELTVHPRNVRTAMGDLTGLVASIAGQGVIEPLTVVPLQDGWQIVAGHRRAAAAIEAGVERVPCLVRPDLVGSDDETSALHVGAMLAENLHREGLTAMEEARGVQQLLDLGVKLSEVSKRTGLGQKRVKKAIGVSRLDDTTAAAVVEHQLDIDQAAAVALYADEPNTMAQLIEAADRGPGNFAHALERAKQDRETQKQYLARRAELQESGRTIIETLEHSGRKNRAITGLKHKGKYLTEQSHASCPGAAVYLNLSQWGQIIEREACTDIVKHGHVDAYSTSTGAAKPETAEEKDAAKAERRLVIENNKAMAAANVVRRGFVKDLLGRRTAPPEVLRFAVEEIAARPNVFSWWLAGNSSPGDKDAADVLGLEPPVRPWSASAKPEKRVTLTSGEHVPDSRLPLQLLAHLAGAIELGIAKDSWRKADHRHAELVRWLRFLAGQGYTLSEVEQQIVDGAVQ